ncbi:MAG: hypothetical protein A2428_12465 [Bdellovibrionales bacterium RIFOXYC1_FULL_54_43]|nr:MAG: hypothetical protein A2428_12465 [Bdellovibrionales bacterium RIFOXYC1_FULL_54_43]OFZ80063.1 MAG: hypothetical protein A2603_17240 [Bdellovibrionales bacterium RIFOXYD1_FULL_55_31]
MPEALIRRALPEDWSKIREICCKTAQAGAEIARERWPFFAELWVGPYQRLLPEWCYVAESPDGEVVAYLTGCPESRKFAAARAIFHSIPLFVKILTRRYDWNGDVSRFVRRTLRLARDPERSFSRRARRLVQGNYPAHLHVNAEASYRGAGIGQKLVERFIIDLKERGFSSGTHIICGSGPVKFYQRTGFETLERLEFLPGVPIYLMGRRA